jgi:hypothetical protein
MQEQPITRAEFNQLVEQVRRIEQETEPMRLERRLSIPEANTLQTIMEMVGRQATDIGTLKTDMEGVKADIKAIRESQADFRDTLKTMATKEDITSIKDTQEQILKLLQQKSGE